MSDPVTNLDIEDVLSSIRRLVSEGDRSPVAVTAPRPAPPPRPAAPGRLILTPALRVHTPEPPPEPEPEPEPEAPFVDLTDLTDLPVVRDEVAEDAPGVAAADEDVDGTTLSAADMRSRLEATIAELEAAITHQSDDWEPDGSEAEPVVDWTSTRAREGTLFSLRTVPRFDLMAEDAEPAAGPGGADEAQSPTDPEPNAATVFDRADAPEAETPDEAEPAFMHAASFHFEPEPEPAAATAPRADDGMDEIRHPFPSGDTEAMDGAASDAGTAGIAAPDGAAGGFDAEDADRGHGEAAFDETVVDEATLRRIVAEVVRDELQGALGERITRNVRKLVRREIYRVLASEDIE